MNIIDVKVINEKCEVLVEKDGEQLKYTLNLNNPKLLKYLNSFLNKKNKELEEAKLDMESDYFGKSLRDGVLCYGISVILAFFLLANTLYASELVGMLGTFGAFVIGGIGHFIKTSIEYDVDPKKEKVVNEIKKEIEGIQDTKKLVSKKVSEKKQEDERKKHEENLQKQKEEYQKMQDELQIYQEEMRIQNIRSPKLSPNEMIILDELVDLARSTDEYRGQSNRQIREALKKKFLEIKNQDLDRRNSEILREMMNEIAPYWASRKR